MYTFVHTIHGKYSFLCFYKDAVYLCSFYNLFSRFRSDLIHTHIDTHAHKQTNKQARKRKHAHMTHTHTFSITHNYAQTYINIHTHSIHAQTCTHKRTLTRTTHIHTYTDILKRWHKAKMQGNAFHPKQIKYIAHD